MLKKIKQNNCQLFSNTLQRIANFNASQWVCGGNGSSALAIDEGRLLVCLLSLNGKDQVDIRVIQASQVLSAEILYEQPSRGNVFLNQMTGAAIGGALFGDAGAIVGADSGKMLSSGSIKGIDLQLTLNDTNNPFHRVVFFPDFSNIISKKEKAQNEAQRWQVLMGIMAKRAAESSPPGIPPAHRESLPPPVLPVREPASLPRPPAPSPRAYGCVLQPAAGAELAPVHIQRDMFTIGRGAGNDLVLNDPAVSRQHAVIRLANGAWFIQDRGSRAGTLVNGQRVQAARLMPGCQFSIGSHRFVFHAE